jgi:hypothetical protein
MKARILLALAFAFALLSGCASGNYRANEFRIGSATSKNIFVDPSQFANHVVKLRLRNSSGDPSIDMSRMRASVESGLRSAGYTVADKGFGIVLDVNLYFMNSVAVGRRQVSNEVGVLLGGVAGYELAKRPGGVAAGSGAILGAIAGSTLQDVLRSNNEYDSYMVVCDVNIGVVKQENQKKDFFVIGGNRIQREQDDDNGTFESFALRETVKVSVYAGDRRENRASVMGAIQDRLARVVSNLI